MDYEGIEYMDYNGRQFVTDGEGPVTKNDNAFELADEFIDDGDRFFSLVSKYDDVLADVFHRKDYKAGDTLRLILPFLKAYGATGSKMVDFSSKNVLLVPGARKTMRFMKDLMPSFIVSTSYEQYVDAVCEIIGFPTDNVYCTEVEIGDSPMDDWEADTLKSYAREIADMSMIEIPQGAQDIEDFSEQDRETIMRLDEIFWEELTDLPSYELILDVNPVGGEEKASSILDICHRTGVGPEDTMYVGDSITDVQAFQLVKDSGGVTVSFNGNEYAIREADIAVMSPDTVVTSALGAAFSNAGREAVMELVANWDKKFLKQSTNIHEYLFREIERVFPEDLPVVERITSENRKWLQEESSRFRKSVRGKEVGQLG